MCKSLIFKMNGGGVRVDQPCALERANLYIANKKKCDCKSLDSLTRSLLLSILNDPFGLRPKQLIEAFPWSSSTVYNSIAKGNWLRKNIEKRFVKDTEKEILDYLLYNDRYLP